MKAIMEQIRSSEIEDWMDELDVLRKERRCRGPKFIKPFHLATLAHILRRDRAIELNLPEKIAPYAHTMNLWEALGIESPFGPQNKNPAGRYYPIQLLRAESAIEPASAALVELFRAVCPDAVTLDAVQVMLRELLGNCFAHADVADGVYGLVCAQVWGAGRKAQIAISDSGIGIRQSLMMNHLLLDRLKYENSCEMATAYGITSKPGRGHSGYGLAVARKLMEQNGGVLYVRSGNEAFYGTATKSFKSVPKSTWHGTLLVIEWDLDTPMDIGEVYAQFPLPEGMTDDDFDF